MVDTWVQTICRCAEHSNQMLWPTVEKAESWIGFMSEIRKLSVLAFQDVCEKITKADMMLFFQIVHLIKGKANSWQLLLFMSAVGGKDPGATYQTKDLYMFLTDFI